MAQAARTASKDLSLVMLGGLMTLKCDLLNCKVQEETVKFSYICPGEDPPVKPAQMYVHPDDLDSGGKVRMWRAGDLDRAREVGKALYRVAPEQIEAAKEPVLPAGTITISVFDAAAVESTTRPNGGVYRLRPKASPQVYAALVDLVADTTKAYVGEMTLRGAQRMYRLQSWNGALVLQETIRPGEFYEAEDYTATYPSALLEQMRGAVNATVGVFDPEQFASILRERAAALDAAVEDPNAAPVPVSPKAAAPDPVEDLMALLASVASTAKAPTEPEKPKAKAKPRPRAKAAVK